MTISQPLDIYHAPLEGISLIEASAGTGKTWAICGLVLRLLLEKEFSINQILVVTFTNAATTELRARIRQRLQQTLTFINGETTTSDPFIADYLAFLQTENPIPHITIRNRLKAALASFDEAAIFTIHSFCQRALGENPFASGLAFSLELGDNRDLMQEVVNDFWRIRIAHGQLSSSLITWLTYRGFTPDGLLKLLQQALNTPLATPIWPEIPDQIQHPDSRSLEEICQQAARCWQQYREEIVSLLHTKLPDLKYLKSEDIDQGATEWDHYFGFNSPLAPIEEKALNFCQSILHDKKTRTGKTPPEHRFFIYADQLQAQKINLEQQLETERLQLLKDFLNHAPEATRKLKKSRHRVDFNDLLDNLHTALSCTRKGAALANNLRQTYPAALIDEFQDTDPLQFAIFHTLYGTGDLPVFLVGDPKQAIYSFRQADLHTYLAARQQARFHYHLDANQRSTEGIITGVNTLFACNPRAFMLPGLDFLPARRGSKPLHDFQDHSGISRSSFHLWHLPWTENELLSRTDAFACSATACAEEIARLLQSSAAGTLLLDQKPLHPGRIAILVRTHRQGQLMKASLSRMGLKAAELSQANVFQSAEAEDMERLLAAILEPGQSGLLKIALATPMLGLTASQIFQLGHDNQALENWIAHFSTAQRHWQTQGIATALTSLGASLGIPGRLLGLPEGERRLTNHLHLTELLHQKEQELPQPIRLFQWFSRQRQEPTADETAQLRLESDQDLINIVTIHKAKGLEYDIVFCPFLWEGRITPIVDRQLGHIYHDNNGQRILDYRHEETGRTPAVLEHGAEILRLYYVALTRPVHRCYLICGAYGKTTASGKSSIAESSRSMLNWLVTGQEFSPEQWLTGESKTLPSLEQISTRWQQLATTMGAILEPLPEPGQTCHVAKPAPSEAYQAAVFTRSLRPDWRIDSFTSLIKGIEEPLGSDRDQYISHSLSPAPANIVPGDFLHFPRGSQGGNCVHHLFENIDFNHPDTWDKAISDTLALHFPASTEQTRQYQDMLEQLLKNVLHSPLPTPYGEVLYLHRLGQQQKLVEMEFHLPVGDLTAKALWQLLAEHKEEVPHLSFQTLKGYLKGFIDLIFCHQGRYYVLDWKSNHLGWTAESYSQAETGKAMSEHGYHLQARIYLLALHRFLKHRLSNYAPEQHLGGAYYLFIRGIRPEWQQKNHQSGVHYLSPKPELLLAMDNLI